MGASAELDVTRHGAVGLLTLCRPEKANAYHQPLLRALDEALSDLEADDSLRALVITGQGRNFCAGADLEELRQRDHREAFVLRSTRFFDRLAASRLVSVAALNGPAVAGGLELALACDLRLAEARAYVRLPELRHGILPAAGGMRRLPRLVGASRAAELILTGRKVEASEALSWGLLLEVVSAEALLPRALSLAQDIAARDGLTLRLAKLVLEQAFSPDSLTRPLEQVSQALLYELAHRRGLE